MNSRFRKSFRIFGDTLKWTVSKKGVSLNFRAGPLSKSWGTRQNTTTVDAPGAMGLSWRKQERRKDWRKGLSVEEIQWAEEQRSTKRWAKISYGFIVLEGLLLLAYMHAEAAIQSCKLESGHPHIALAGFLLGQTLLVTIARSCGWKGPGSGLVAVATGALVVYLMSAQVFC